jgi:hypothetical protein
LHQSSDDSSSLEIHWNKLLVPTLSMTTGSLLAFAQSRFNHNARFQVYSKSTSPLPATAIVCGENEEAMGTVTDTDLKIEVV